MELVLDSTSVLPLMTAEISHVLIQLVYVTLSTKTMDQLVVMETFAREDACQVFVPPIPRPMVLVPAFLMTLLTVLDGNVSLAQEIVFKLL
jgi:hypothetical protein